MNRTLRALALSAVSKQRFANFINKERASDLERLTGFIDAGQVTPSIDRTYPLDQVPEAMRQLEAGQARQGRHHHLSITANTRRALLRSQSPQT